MHPAPGLRFCFGASGAGKSTLLYQEVINESLSDPETSFLIVVPDQFTMQVQRDVVRMHPRHGIMNIDVLSFSRLMHRVFDETGEPQIPVLDDLGKTLVLRHVGALVSGDLKVLGGKLSLPGFADEVKSLISEFLQYRITPADLERLQAACGMRGQLAARLADIRTIYSAFNDYIEGKFSTAEASMEILAERIPRSALLRDAVVVFDGFTGFTPIQYQVLLSILHTAKRMMVSLLADPEETPDGRPAADGLFALSAKTAADLERLLEENKKSSDIVTKDIITNDIIIRGRPVRRLAENPPLAFLERHLFRVSGASYAEDPGDAVRISEAANPQEECDACCLAIRQALREDPSLRFEDIAVLSTDPETYGILMEKTAAGYDIPVYVDESRKIRMNPLVECMESALEILAEGFTSAAVFRFLRCPLTGFDAGAVDRLQLYVEALGIRGRKRWEETFLRIPRSERTPEEQAELLTEANALRERLCTLILPFTEGAGSRHDVRSISAAVIRLFETLQAEEAMQRLAAEREQAGDSMGAREASQIYGKVTDLIGQMVRLLGDEQVSIRAYSELLRTGIDKITIGMLPGSIDRVIVGDLERTRLGEKQILFLLGANDMLLPKADSGGGLLGEMDRRFLAEVEPSVELAPDPVQRLGYDRQYLYMNLTKPRRMLVLSYALTGSDGRSLRPADLIRMVRQLFPKLQICGEKERPFAARIETPANACVLAAAGMRDYKEKAFPESEQAAYRTLLEVLSGTDAASAAFVQKLREAAATRYRPKPLHADTADALYGRTLENSVSRLELFAGCPFAHFANYGLHLREEDRFSVNPADVGTVYHHVLEQAGRYLKERHMTWRDFSPEEGREMVRVLLRREAEQYRNNLLFSNNRYLYMTKRLERILVRTVDTVQYQLKKGIFQPVAAEWDFRKLGESPETVIPLGGADGARMILNGRIDRLDACTSEGRQLFRVVDFKSGAHKFDPTLFYYGVELQLMLYARVAARAQAKEHPDSAVVPAGVFYYQVKDPMLSADSDKITDDIESAIRKKLAFTGVANSDTGVLALMDSDFAETGKSDILPAALKKGAGFTANSHVLSAEDFAEASAHVGRLAVSFGQRIRGGDVAVSPYRYEGKSSCTYCAYRRVCGFDRRIPGYDIRDLRKMRDEEIMQRIRTDNGNGASAAVGTGEVAP